MKVAIVGSRDFSDLALVREYISGLHPYDQVVSGGARGVDLYAEQCAIFFGLDVVSFPADWEKHGKSAGFIRNKQIVDYADRIVAFWDGKSRGTAHTIDLARKAGKPVDLKVSPVAGEGAATSDGVAGPCRRV